MTEESIPPRNVAEQIDEAYRRMADEAHYRPSAPSDGFGNIPFPKAELDLEAEVRDYARRWWGEEQALDFFIGCCDFPTRPATIYAVEAARLMCGANPETAATLLRMALEDLTTKPAP